ncbi:pectinesterase [Magnaporthiopsis poae ATCC 64411]|uniref:Pectinesterase n=1 Tax=Magnaporthiopsis poae (strain ATCC 64411 / 73-15) TaxID=644358 RepID=A0A0C4DQS6_MAGP6|nr:pectinesterase [Magnaporthiopsis poae ATCC 64411]
MKSLSLLISLATAVLAASRTSAPSGCIMVSKSGGAGNGRFTTVQAAVDSLSKSSSADQCIFIDKGTYNEQVLVSARKARLSIYGYSTDTSSHSGNGATITSSKSQKDGLSNDQTATLRVKAAGFRLYNVNVNNGFGEGSQAVALSAYDDSGYYGCRFTGFQDTVLANEGRQLYAKCLIQGATDFIFGQKAVAWFQKSDIRVLSKQLGYITANGRDKDSNPSYYVFNSCNIQAAAGNNVPAGAYYLGRPWRAYARVVFQHTSMTNVINQAGWTIWNSGDERTSNVLFGEIGNSGPGSQGNRARFAKKLGQEVSINEILGDGHQSEKWYDAAYM